MTVVATPTNPQVVVTPVPGVPTDPTAAPIPATPSTSVQPVTQPGTDPESVVRLMEQARQDEKQKVYSTISKLKDENKSQVDRVTELTAKVEELTALTNKDLSADERVKLQIDNFKEQLATEVRERKADQVTSNELVRQSQLEAYKHQQLATVGTNLIATLVGGDSHEAIDSSIAIAKAEYIRLQAQMEVDFVAKYGTQPGQQAPQTIEGMANQSQYYTPPVGFPAEVNPAPVTQQQMDLTSVMDVTSEEAVRSGQYEKFRGQLLGQLKSVSPASGSQVLGNQPRHMGTPQNHVPMPNGVQQPMGNPTGPVVNPGMNPQNRAIVGQGVPAAVGNQLVPDARAMAMDAVNRTNSGQNPLVSQQQHLAPPGVLPQGGPQDAAAAHSNRFNPTPPITQS